MDLRRIYSKNQGECSRVNASTIVLWIITLTLFLFSWKQGTDTVKKGAQLAWSTTKKNGLLIILAFIIAGFVTVLSPEDLVTAWIGPNSGWRGIISAEFLGALLPGGPYVVFPIIAILVQAGAGLGPAIALITSWSTQSLLTISFELPFMGWRFTAIRWTTGLLIPLLAGFTAILLWG
ncbi:MAG: hypothetical protein DRI65_16165 [Chloroflexota bacterium]|nr:MAG: hypothetical protein DRI65_16165 [Chloroflexota bacterium]